MNNFPVDQFKKVSLVLSSLALTTCIAMPLTVHADTNSSVDAIMEQLKAFKTQAPKVTVPTPVVEESKTTSDDSDAKKEEASEEKPVVKEAPARVEVAPVIKKEIEKKSSMTVDNSAVIIPERKQAAVTKKKSKKRYKKKVNKQTREQDFKAFDKDYLSLIDQILSEKPQAQKTVNRVMQSTNGVSGWIYLGRYTDGQWDGSSTLSSGSALPQAGQQYKVQSTHLNLRKSRPLKDGLGKLVKVLRAGEQVSVQKVHRSSRNNYWANVTRP